MLDSRWIHFFKRNGWTFVAALFCLVSLGYFLEQKFSSHKATAKEFAEASSLFRRILDRESLSKESLESACTLLKQYPELLTQYQGILSIALAQGGFTNASLDYSKSHLNRISTLSSPLHKEFAETGFLITDNQFDKALEKSLELEKNLQNSTSYPRLRAFNLMRIAFLSRETHNEEMAKKTFEMLSESPFIAEIRALFSEGSFTLNDFFVEIPNKNC